MWPICSVARSFIPKAAISTNKFSSGTNAQGTYGSSNCSKGLDSQLAKPSRKRRRQSKRRADLPARSAYRSPVKNNNKKGARAQRTTNKTGQLTTSHYKKTCKRAENGVSTKKPTGVRTALQSFKLWFVSRYDIACIRTP